MEAFPDGTMEQTIWPIRLVKRDLSLLDINIWWVIVKSVSICCLQGFQPPGWTWLKSQGTFGCTLQHKSVANIEVCSAVFHAPPAWQKPRSPLRCLSRLYNVFMADSLAATQAVLETNIAWLKGQDKGKGEPERGKERTGWKGWVGFPGFPLPRIPSQSSGLCQLQACPGTFLNPDFTSLPLCPHTTSLSPWARQWIKALFMCTSTPKASSAGQTGRHFLETVANNSGKLCPESGREAGSGCVSIPAKNNLLICKGLSF